MYINTSLEFPLSLWKQSQFYEVNECYNLCSSGTTAINFSDKIIFRVWTKTSENWRAQDYKVTCSICIPAAKNDIEKSHKKPDSILLIQLMVINVVIHFQNCLSETLSDRVFNPFSYVFCIAIQVCFDDLVIFP